MRHPQRRWHGREPVVLESSHPLLELSDSWIVPAGSVAGSLVVSNRFALLVGALLRVGSRRPALAIQRGR
jgi:hypothetical protein